MAVTYSADAAAKRETFLRIVFDKLEGYICVARVDRKTKEFSEAFYRVPDQFEALFSTVDQWASKYDVYFCPMVLKQPKRTKDTVASCHMVWADLDECHPDLLHVTPSIVTETSPGRYQALWRLAAAVDPVVAETISYRIAYAHQKDGADTSGWDLTQLMRLPFTANFKYANPSQIYVLTTSSNVYTPASFDEEYPDIAPPVDAPLPELDDLPYAGDARRVLEEHRLRIQPYVHILFETEPEATKWSEHLWKLEMMLFESGLTPAEVFVVAKEAACNKFRRDGRADVYLWRDVLRAYQKYELMNKSVPDDVVHTSLLSDEERALAEANYTIIEEYTEWAKTLGDAAWEYHQAGAFVCLSSLLAGPVRLPTSFGTLVPNLWFMILADTTLTRKTTAMDIAMDMITEIDSDAILATDGSIEGLFSSLSTRPGRPSIFLRDEFSGLLEMIGKKDYYAGMAETFTKMYDGKYQKRVLRREVIEVKEPVLIMFTGGIKERILSLLNYEHVASGFLPRFIFVSAESDVSKLRPLGPPTMETIEKRYDLLRKLSEMHAHYTTIQTVTIGGKSTASPKRWDATLTPEAWERYNKFERDMLDSGLASFHRALVTPMFDRLSKTALKLAVLLAASRQRDSKVTVEVSDILKAISYIENWKVYSAMIVNSVGKTAAEKILERIRATIEERPGIMRSEVMQMHRLNAREADNVFQTLDQRGQISRIRAGRTERLYIIK